MELFSRVFQLYHKNKGFILLSSFLSMSPLSFATTTCPALKINALCLSETWQISIVPGGEKWQLMSESVNGARCNNQEQVDDLFWNYAFSSARMGLVGCTYTLYNNRFNRIGQIRIKSIYYEQTGEHWVKGSQPGIWKCQASQNTCLFS